jgi:hypothetical protein
MCNLRERKITSNRLPARVRVFHKEQVCGLGLRELPPPNELDDAVWFNGPTVPEFQGSNVLTLPWVQWSEESRNQGAKKGLFPDVGSFGNGQVAASRATISPGIDCELCFQPSVKNLKSWIAVYLPNEGGDKSKSKFSARGRKRAGTNPEIGRSRDSMRLGCFCG